MERLGKKEANKSYRNTLWISMFSKTGKPLCWNFALKIIELER